MKELQDIVDAYNKAVIAGVQSALATVVHVEGSSYRRPGARMLVTEDGKLTGAISGGCLEGDAKRKALMVMAWQKPMVVTYDTTDEDDAKLGVGLGCNGIIHILIEPILKTDLVNPIHLLSAIISKRQVATLATLFSLSDKRATDQGTFLLQNKEESITTFPFTSSIFPSLTIDAKEALQKRTSSIKTYNKQFPESCLFDVIEPVITLVIAGAGNDVIPLVKLSAVMGWKTKVVDGRSNLCTVERFPEAEVVIVAPPDKALNEIILDKRTAVLLMTHNYNYDLAVLKQTLKSDPGFIGVLGPKKKLDKMLHELQETSEPPIEEWLQKIYGPVGLDIGAETSEEIALSIVAEIKAVFSDRQGTSLRDKTKPIHSIETT